MFFQLGCGGERVVDIPSLMAGFNQESNSSFLDALIKPAPLMAKDKKKELLNVLMDFDLDQNCISFSFEPYDEESERRYNYFGNNPAAAKQIYVVRDVASLMNYWVGRPRGIMQNVFEFLEQGELRSLLKECLDQELFTDQGISCDKVDGKLLSAELVVKREEKALYLNNEKYSPEKVLKEYGDLGNNTKLMLVIPRIIKGKEIYILSLHQDYIQAIESFLQGQGTGDIAVCHICGKKKTDVNTKEYSSKLSKSSIGKVFVTTTVNYAPLFNKNDHQKNYSICKSCYEKLMFGEKKAMQDFKIKVAHEDCVLLFSGVKETMDISYIENLRKGIDICFNPNDSDKWLKSFQEEIQEQTLEFYQFHMIFYKTDGKSCAIKKTIESISSIRWKQVNDEFDETRKNLGEFLRYFSIGHLYNMIPVNTNKKGEQLDIARVLDLYSAIIKGELVEKNFIFDLAAEALERGIHELNSSTLRNYKNLDQLVFLHDKPYGIDSFIARICMKYIALIHALQHLKVLDKEVFFKVETENREQDLPDFIVKMEEFLQNQGFSQEAKGLFYLGVLIHKVGVAQYKQKHEHKPILDKITYNGMNTHDVINLYEDVLEKIRQYRSVIKPVGLFYCEQVQKQLHKNMGYIANQPHLTEKENVFYIMAGYAYCVSYKKENKLEGEDNDQKQP